MLKLNYFDFFSLSINLVTVAIVLRARRTFKHEMPTDKETRYIAFLATQVHLCGGADQYKHELVLRLQQYRAKLDAGTTRLKIQPFFAAEKE